MPIVTLLLGKNTFKTPNFKSMPWIGEEVGDDSGQQYLPDRKTQGDWAKELSVGDIVELNMIFDNGTFKYVKPIDGRAVRVIPPTPEAKAVNFAERYGEFEMPKPSRTRAVPIKRMEFMRIELDNAQTLIENFTATTSYWRFLANEIVKIHLTDLSKDEADTVALKAGIEQFRASGALESMIKAFEDDYAKAMTRIGRNDGGKKDILEMTATFIATPSISTELSQVVDNWGVIENMAGMADESVPLLAWMVANDAVGDTESKVSERIETILEEVVHGK